MADSLVSDTAPEASTFTLMTYNIWLGGAGRMDAITGIVREVNPDLLGIQEADDEDAIERLADRLGMQYVHATANTIHHVAFLSRFPIDRMVNHDRPIMRKTMLEAHVVLPGGETLRVYCAHLNAFASSGGERRRVREMEAILSAIAPHTDEPHLLFGDFNALAPGDSIVLERVTAHIANRVTRAEVGRVRPRRPLTFGRLLDSGISRGLLVPETLLPRMLIRHVLEAGYSDCYRGMHPDVPGFTFPAPDPALRLDYIFAPAGMRVRLLGCDVVDLPQTTIASDHRPLVARFSL